MSAKPPARSHTQNLLATTVLINTGASVSLMPLWQANALKLDIKKPIDIMVRGADGDVTTSGKTTGGSMTVGSTTVDSIRQLAQ